ncbi:MAG: UbiA family prenyltransferase, partial [Myxococcota bacterium]
MGVSSHIHSVAARPDPRAVLTLLKPVTWFPPMWAFTCGVVSSARPLDGRGGLVALGVAITGPLVCASSQAVNDWYDRHVDAINEPHRPIPSGRIPGRWGLGIAIAWTVMSLLAA